MRGDALLSGGGIEVASGAHLDLYVEGALTVEWSGAIRAEDGAPAVSIHVLGEDWAGGVRMDERRLRDGA